MTSYTNVNQYIIPSEINSDPIIMPFRISMRTFAHDRYVRA